MAEYLEIDSASGEVVAQYQIPAPPADPNAIDIAALKATVAKATTVPALRGAMMAYLDAVAAQQS